MAEVGLRYRLVSSNLFEYNKINLDDIIRSLRNSAGLAVNIKQGKELIKSKYSHIQVRGKIPQGIRSLEYKVYFEGEEKDLAHAISDFMEICGTPVFVSGMYELAEEPLKKYGKVFKRKIEGLLVGRHVVDKADLK